MDLFQLKVDKFTTIDQSARFKEAQKLIQEHQLLLSHIKADMKKRGITIVQVEKPTCIKTLKFEIKERTSVDVHALPDDIKAQYMETNEIWYKKVDIVDKLE